MYRHGTIRRGHRRACVLPRTLPSHSGSIRGPGPSSPPTFAQLPLSTSRRPCSTPRSLALWRHFGSKNADGEVDEFVVLSDRRPGQSESRSCARKCVRLWGRGGVLGNGRRSTLRIIGGSIPAEKMGRFQIRQPRCELAEITNVTHMAGAWPTSSRVRQIGAPAIFTLTFWKP